MSGFSTSDRKIYASVMGGKFRLKATEKSDTAIVQTRIKKTGEQVTEEVHDQLEGWIKDISFDLGNSLGPMLNIVVNAGFDVSFSLSLKGGPSKAFLKTLPNVDLSKELIFKPRVEEFLRPDGSKGTSNSMLLKQNGAWLKQYFKKDAMNGMPDYTKVLDKLTKKETLDDSDQVGFLVEYTVKHTLPKLIVAAPKAATIIAEEEEELPF